MTLLDVQDEDFSDPEDFVDNITDEELMPDLVKNRPVLNNNLSNIIVVDNIPKVGQDRMEKLKTALKKIFSKFGTIVEEYYPIDDNNTTLGYVFVEYANRAEADTARKNLNGYRMDKSHQFIVNSFTDFDYYVSITDEWEKPQVKEYVDPGNLLSWLTEPNCLDQFCVLYDRKNLCTACFLNTSPVPTELIKRMNWSESVVQWSPKGTYLASFHDQGIALWGGEKFGRIQKLAHPGVQKILFSPCERYLITYSPSQADKNSIYVWDIITCTVKRTFPKEDASQVWPYFKWSFDGNFFARLGNDCISVYDSKTCGLHDKKSVKLPSVVDFEWSPSEPMFAFWVAERKDTPARVSVMEFPSRNEIRSKNLFNVASCSLFWHNKGYYLGVQVDRYLKQKYKDDMEKPKYSNIYHNFEIFRFREKNCPVDSLEIKSSCRHFSWEPNGHRFVIIHESGTPSKTKVTFYKVLSGCIQEIKEFQYDVTNAEWAPSGNFIVLFSTKNRASPNLIFIDVNEMTVLNETEHMMAKYITWDPTGRYLASCVFHTSQPIDHGYMLWSFQGKCLAEQRLADLSLFLWRPRPPILLTEEKMREIKRNLKQYSVKYESMDKLSAMRLSKEHMEKRQQMLEEFEAIKARSLGRLEAQMKERAKLRKARDTDTEEWTEEIVEFLLSTDEQRLDAGMESFT